MQNGDAVTGQENRGARLIRCVDIDDDWNLVLRSYGMDSLHISRAFKATDLLSPKIGKQTFAERIDTLKPFADCIRKHFEYGIATAIDVAAFKAMSKAAKKQLGNAENAHYVAFLQGMMGFLHHLRPEDRISFICDDDEETAFNCYQFYRRARKVYPPANDHFVAISFADDRYFPALQAADFLASLTRMRARNEFFKTPYDDVALFEYLTAPQPLFTWGTGFWDKERLGIWDPKLEARTKAQKRHV